MAGSRPFLCIARRFAPTDSQQRIIVQPAPAISSVQSAHPHARGCFFNHGFRNILISAHQLRVSFCTSRRSMTHHRATCTNPIVCAICTSPRTWLLLQTSTMVSATFVFPQPPPPHRIAQATSLPETFRYVTFTTSWNRSSRRARQR